ncbi:M56 family metallopeptidase [Paenibacillus sp. sptzw28]|nr:M56 family metallopeptidase [Paenibacillus sp. sptzw28]
MIARQTVMFGKTMRKLMLCQDLPMTKLYGKAHHLNGKQFMIITHPMPIAVTMGLLRPRVVISTGLLNLMEEDEIEAVIEHEKYHLRHRDPLQMFLLSMLSVSMWYIPIFKWLSVKYNLIIEVMADKHAISKVGSSDVLGSALLKILKQGPLPVLTHSHASFAETSINVRIVHILDPHTQLSVKLPVLRSIVSMIAAFLLLLAVTAP